MIGIRRSSRAHALLFGLAGWVSYPLAWAFLNQAHFPLRSWAEAWGYSQFGLLLLLICLISAPWGQNRPILGGATYGLVVVNCTTLLYLCLDRPPPGYFSYAFLGLTIYSALPAIVCSYLFAWARRRETRPGDQGRLGFV